MKSIGEVGHPAIDEGQSGIFETAGEAFSNFTQQRKSIVFQCRELSAESFALCLHGIIELAAFACGVLKGRCNHFGADSALRHFFFQLRNTFASHLADFVQGIEALIYHLQEILSHELTGRLALRKGQSKSIEFFLVALRDIAKHFHDWQNFFFGCTKSKQSLRALCEVRQLKRRFSSELFNLRDHVLRLFRAAEHGPKTGDILLHLSVVFYTGHSTSGQSGCSACE